MAKLAILDYKNTKVLVVDVCEEQVKKLEDIYDNDTYYWLCEEGIDDKLEISINNIDYLWLDDNEPIKNIEIKR